MYASRMPRIAAAVVQEAPRDVSLNLRAEAGFARDRLLGIEHQVAQLAAVLFGDPDPGDYAEESWTDVASMTNQSSTIADRVSLRLANLLDRLAG